MNKHRTALLLKLVDGYAPAVDIYNKMEGLFKYHDVISMTRHEMHKKYGWSVRRVRTSMEKLTEAGLFIVDHVFCPRRRMANVPFFIVREIEEVWAERTDHRTDLKDEGVPKVGPETYRLININKHNKHSKGAALSLARSSEAEMSGLVLGNLQNATMAELREALRKKSTKSTAKTFSFDRVPDNTGDFEILWRNLYLKSYPDGFHVGWDGQTKGMFKHVRKRLEADGVHRIFLAIVPQWAEFSGWLKQHMPEIWKLAPEPDVRQLLRNIDGASQFLQSIAQKQTEAAQPKGPAQVTFGKLHSSNKKITDA